MRKSARCLAGLLSAVLVLLLSLPLAAAGAEPTGTLIVRVQTPGGVPVFDASLSVTGTTGEYDFRLQFVGMEGHTLRVPAGTYQVSAAQIRHDDAASQTVTVAANEIKQVTVVLSEPVTPGQIRGTVTDASTGKAMAGIEVWIMRGGGQGSLSVRSDQKGAFRFSGLPAGTYTVASSPFSASMERAYTTDNTTVELRAGDESEVGLRVVPTGRVTAEVTTPDGKKADGAELIVSPVGAPASQSQTIRADWWGRLSGTLAPGVYTIKAAGLRYTDSEAQRVTVMPGETYGLTFTVQPLPTGTIRGTVTDGTGAPVANARVALYDARQQQVGSSVRTGADGVFVFEKTTVGSYQLRSSATDYVPSGDPPAVTVTAGETSTPVLTMSQLVTVKVRLLDPAGKVIRSGYIHKDGKVTSPSADREGNLLLRTLPGEIVLAAEAFGYLLSENQTVHVGAPGDPTLITFALQPVPVGTIEGRIVDAVTGNGVSDMVVHLKRVDDGLRLAGSVRVDANGKFTFTDVRPGRYELDASVYLTRTDPVTVTVEQGKVSRAELAVRRFGQLEVRVVDMKRQAVPGARVETRGEGGEPWPVTANYLGRAVYQLEAGSYQVTASAPGMRVKAVQVANVAHGKSTMVLVTMEPADR